jgi:NAD-dependent deacetylase
MNGGNGTKNDTDSGNDLDAAIDLAARRIANSTRMVVSTGSGMSKESGIPTFRDEDGLWQNHRPEELATREGFLSNPGLAWKWYRERFLTARIKEPNPGHYALAELEKLKRSYLLITQNVDNLHRRAGSGEIVELHGNIERFRCLDYSHPAKPDPSWDDSPPICHCGSPIRPDVVWFGEPLPQAELECAFRESGKCDLFLVVGTSGVVQPAASLPFIAKRSGAFVIEINVAESEITRIADLFLRGKSGVLLPKVVGRVKEISSGGE